MAPTDPSDRPAPSPKKTPRARSFVNAALAALTALAAASPSAALTGCSAGTPTPVEGREMRLTLLHTADWHSRLFPYNQRVSATDAALGLQQDRAPFGGAARINWLIQRERARADRLLHLDSGDCFQGAPIFNFFGGEAEVRALAATGVDGVLIGNHEFDRGALNLYRQFNAWANFPVLAANYQWDDPTTPGSAELGRIARPYHIYNVRGLKVGVIGFGNLSSITSIYDQPNRPGITALDSVEVAQHYIDMLQAQNVDLIVGLSHLGLEADDHMVERTSGFDVVLGGHLHIVLNPSQQVRDCQPFDESGQHFIPILSDPTQRLANCNPEGGVCCNPSGVCPPEPARAMSNPIYSYWRLAPGYRARTCSPRPVVVQHSGAFMKYLGRLDIVVSDDPARIGEGRIGEAANADSTGIHRFELVSSRFTLFPVDSTIPEEPVMKQLLEPYARTLDTAANLDTIIGYSPNGVSRTNEGGGDSPMGNLVTTAMWLRLGVQTDFALTNTLGIRDAIPNGPVTIDQIYNVFPFDNSITTLQLSGREVRDMFDFIARRSSSRGCNSQAQVSGVRVVISCNGCDRDGVPGDDTEINNGVESRIPACAETINIGLARTQTMSGEPTGVPERCDSDGDCNPGEDHGAYRRSLCEPRSHQCMQPVEDNASYALAANDFIAAGGSGFFVLQRNTTQLNTFVQLRDAVIDYVQASTPCGYDEGTAQTYRAGHANQPPRADDGLQICQVDGDCPEDYACSCQGRVSFGGGVCSDSGSCEGESGRCVLRQCRDDVAALAARDCPPDQPGVMGADARARCLCAAQGRGGESCRILACFDASVGADADNRLRMISR